MFHSMLSQGKTTSFMSDTIASIAALLTFIVSISLQKCQAHLSTNNSEYTLYSRCGLHKADTTAARQFERL